MTTSFQKHLHGLVSTTALALYLAAIIVGLGIGYGWHFLQASATDAATLPATRTFVGEQQMVDFLNSSGFAIGSTPERRLEGSSLRADDATASKICEVAGYASVASTHTDHYSSPSDNEIAYWSSTQNTFVTVNAAVLGNPAHLDGLTCANPFNQGTPTPTPNTSPTPTATPTATPTSIPTDHNPISFFDGFNSGGANTNTLMCQAVQGWACDPDNFNATLDVHLYDGPAEQGRLIAVVHADQNREAAIGNFCGGTTNHAFFFPIPASLKDNAPHQIYAYAINIGAGNNIHMPGSPSATMQCSAGATPTATPTVTPIVTPTATPTVTPTATPTTTPTGSGSQPIGYLDGAVSCEVIEGWACDADNFNQALDIHLYDGPAGSGRFIGSFKADQPREAAIGAQCGGNSSHSFLANIPTWLKDGQVHDIYGYAINIGPANQNTHLAGSPIHIQCGPGTSHLVVQKTANVSSVQPGQSITYTVTISNTGAGTAPAVRAIDRLAAGLVFIPGGSTAGCVLNGSQVECPAFDYTPGSSHSFNIQVQLASNMACGINNGSGTSNVILDNVADIWGQNGSLGGPLTWSNHVQTPIFCNAGSPTPTPTSTPTATPTATPSSTPTPTATPTVTPTTTPTATPTVTPTPTPSAAPVINFNPVINNNNSVNTGSTNVSAGETHVSTGETHVDVHTGSQNVTVNIPRVAGATTYAPSAQKIYINADGKAVDGKGKTVYITNQNGIAVPITAATGPGTLSLVSTLLGGTGLSFLLRRFL
jgi:uncharacterized repeat protein (TIGR01451 family)